MDRRKFLKSTGLFISATSTALQLPVSSCQMASSGMDRKRKLSDYKWGMLIDLNRCVPGCTECLTACRNENNVAFHGDERWDVHWLRKVNLKDHQTGNEKSVLLLCNHCEHPPCAQVCPVQATYKREDGIVIVDHHRCIGCRYCMIACPYNARFFNFKENPDWPNKDYPKRSHGVVESCNFCAHRVDQGMKPACVEACEKSGNGAILFGNLNDRDSDISRKIAANPVKRIREDFGTEPKVYYLGL